MAAFSVVELMFVLGIAATLASLVVPSLRAGLDDMRAVAASRHVMARLQQARGRAVMRGRATAVRLTPSATGYVVSMYEDGNGNGVLAADIATGVDALVRPIERLTAKIVVARPLLHAYKLAITHPRTGAPLAFEAPVPEDIAQLCQT